MFLQGCAGMKYRGDFVSDKSTPSRDAIQVTYLGTNGYLFVCGGTTILVDPYFSRVPLGHVALNLPIKPDQNRITRGLSHLPRKIDCILVTHGHLDHLLDVPEIARRTGATVIASQTSCRLARAAGLPEKQTRPVKPGQSLRLGTATVLILPAVHDKLFGHALFPGIETAVPSPPATPGDWKAGEPLAFLVEMNGSRIYLDSGGVPEAPPPLIAPVDLAIIGMALPDDRARLSPMLERLKPRYFLPSHQDDFFRPLDRGFRFGPLSDFGAVRDQWNKHHAPERLILLDYFEPWSLR